MMALANLRGPVGRLGGMRIWLTRSNPLGLHSPKMAVICPIQVATLQAAHGESLPRRAPFPYETKTYTILHHYFDRTDERMAEENAKVIVVEGNVGVGKHAFAKRLAKEFDLKYFPQPAEAELFTCPDTGYDIRKLDKYLPPGAHSYDFHNMYRSVEGAKTGKPGGLQIAMYKNRFLRYALALQHVLNTGQGVVLVRSPYSDAAFAETLRRLGYMTPEAFNYYYNVIRLNTLCELLKPHLTIYLDTPVHVCRQNIENRASEMEVNSPVLTDKFLQTLEDSYKEKVLPEMRKFGALVEYDWSKQSEETEWEMIIEDLERLDLVCEDKDEPYFLDWHELHNDMLTHYRKVFGTAWKLQGLFRFAIDYSCPEIYLEGEDAVQWRGLMARHPLVQYMNDYNPHLHSPGKLMLKF